MLVRIHAAAAKLAHLHDAQPASTRYTSYHASFSDPGIPYISGL
jgi:hypothetical protein